MHDHRESYPTEGIVVPPGCETTLLTNSGEKVQTYTPSSYRPYSPPVPPHGMRGKTDGVSIPKNPSPSVLKSISDYLRQFQGATICLDLWVSRQEKWKRCGILVEVGETFLVMGEPATGKLSIVDLKPVRYLNIYCK